MADPLFYSFHAAKRCLERGITERNVEDTVRLGNRQKRRKLHRQYSRGLR